uniref:RRM domain-containing protein n=1 Tax=Taeniopygia guttata TaxID=59729 RepID=A0A674HDB0_TAEGU
PSGLCPRTVLVRGLPAGATAALLERLFGHLGPVRRCFVVTEKGSPRCRGFGFVTFSLAEDAGRALREPPELGGRPLVLSARGKGRKTREKGESKERRRRGRKDTRRRMKRKKRRRKKRRTRRKKLHSRPGRPQKGGQGSQLGWGAANRRR